MSDFDQMGIVVDWVDACRKGDLATLLDLYADDARVECMCNGKRHYRGRHELETYWGPRLSTFSSAGFGLEEINPVPHGIDLEYPVGRSKSPGYGHLKLPHLMIAVSAA
ncbi:nuclear transport factor 2 family protein, partial [Bradyrhizobium liaoningense]|uniref:nuclear transport factor 2 family protein n=1 Tax=Bradyrhizobium liaoningense TaxID=43992 RepID=UPI00289EDDDB